MFLIPGELIALLTFPGVVAHEIAHRFFADLAKVEAYKVCYFRFGNPAGFVIHGPVKGLRNSFLISVGPFIINTILCALLTFSAVIPSFILDVQNPNPVFILLIWVGLSIGMHAFPSNEDMKNLVNEVNSNNNGGLLPIAAKLFANIFKIANALRRFWFDFIYAIGVSLFLPWFFGLL